MSVPTAAWLGFFSIVVYVLIADINAQDYLSLYLTFLNQKLRKFLYSLKWNPRYPWARLWIKHVASRNSRENARLLVKELGLDQD
jgi:hypothetical protein